MPSIDLELILSSDRDISGTLIVKERDSGKVLEQFEALGRGSQGPEDTQLWVNGNTPTGNYRVTQIQDTSTWSQHSYGPHGALRIEPIDGNALIAAQIIGRKGLLIHGGSLGGANYWRGANELRATHGCVRLANSDMMTLVQLLFVATIFPEGKQCVPIEVRLTVSESN